MLRIDSLNRRLRLTQYINELGGDSINDLSADRGLIYLKGKAVSLDVADKLAQLCGLGHAEQLVELLEDGTIQLAE